MKVSEFPDDLRGQSPYRLADMAGLCSPDSHESPGARWLLTVGDIFLEQLACGQIEARQHPQWRRDDALSTLSGDCATGYTSLEAWRIWTDLGLWQHSSYVRDDFGMPDDITQHAEDVLCEIARQLLSALADQLDSCDPDDDEEDDEEEEGTSNDK